MTKTSDFIRVRQASRMLKCSESHVYKLARTGLLSKYFIGVRSYRLSKSEVVEYMHTRKMCRGKCCYQSQLVLLG